jgi:hypothetical protein
MIPTITHLLYRVHHERQYWLTRAEKRRAALLLGGIVLCIGLSVLLWILK